MALDQHALEPRRCTAVDIFTLTGDVEGEGAAIIAATEAYLSVFAAPTLVDGDQCCFHCGKPISAFKHAFGTGVAYVWGFAHGEAACSGCGWPARGMHYAKDDNGEELFTLRNFFLAYHPDAVTQEAA